MYAACIVNFGYGQRFHIARDGGVIDRRVLRDFMKLSFQVNENRERGIDVATQCQSTSMINRWLRPLGGILPFVLVCLAALVVIIDIPAISLIRARLFIAG
jgi:hypothetical protein